METCPRCAFAHADCANARRGCAYADDVHPSSANSGDAVACARRGARGVRRLPPSRPGDVRAAGVHREVGLSRMRVRCGRAGPCDPPPGRAGSPRRPHGTATCLSARPASPRHLPDRSRRRPARCSSMSGMGRSRASVATLAGLVPEGMARNARGLGWGGGRDRPRTSSTFARTGGRLPAQIHDVPQMKDTPSPDPANRRAATRLRTRRGWGWISFVQGPLRAASFPSS